MGQVWPGDTLTAKGTVKSVDPEAGAVEIELVTTNQDGRRVIVGQAAATLPVS